MNNILQNKEIYGIIYCATNLINKNKYVGQTIKNLNDRWHQHKYQALNYNSQIYFHRAIRKYGEENFSVEILDYAYSSEELNQKEEDWIYILNTLNEGYNLTTGGSQCEHSEKTRYLKSLSQIKRHQLKPLSEESKKLIGMKNSKKLKGRKQSAERIEKNRLSHLNIKPSEETKEKISRSLQNHEVSEETREKLRKAHNGRKQSEETINKKRLALQNHEVSEETREKLRQKHKNRKYYHHIETGEIRGFLENDIIPDGFVKGRK
jgi:group I intron endonuclease